MFFCPNSMGLVWGGVGPALLRLLNFSAIVATSAIWGTSVPLWCTLWGLQAGIF